MGVEWRAKCVSSVSGCRMVSKACFESVGGLNGFENVFQKCVWQVPGPVCGIVSKVLVQLCSKGVMKVGVCGIVLNVCVFNW